VGSWTGTERRGNPAPFCGRGVTPTPSKTTAYRKFRIGDLFDIHPTKSYGLTNPKLFKRAGNTPVIVNSSRENGIGGYVDLEPKEKHGIITFSDTTTSDSIFYQPRDFIGYSHVQGVYPKSPKRWTKEALLFVVVNFRKVSAGRLGVDGII
jgi:hypothetical protein